MVNRLSWVASDSQHYLRLCPLNSKPPEKTTSRPLGFKANTEYLSKTQYPGCFKYERGLKTTHLRRDSTRMDLHMNWIKLLAHASCYIKISQTSYTVKITRIYQNYHVLVSPLQYTELNIFILLHDSPPASSFSQPHRARKKFSMASRAGRKGQMVIKKTTCFENQN